MAEPAKKQEIAIKMPDTVAGGVYANNVLITHSKEEFIMTFMMVVPPKGIVTSRVIMSPGHVKRFINALHVNMKKYESDIGTIEAATPPKARMGFVTS